MIRKWTACLTLLLLCALCNGEERIELFHSDIQLHSNNTATIEETIAVKAEGREIVRGIFRVLPRGYTTPKGAKKALNYSVTSVTRNGNEEPFTVYKNGVEIKISIGTNTPIEHGIQTYKITYLADDAAAHFPNYDEFYWNITGNYWGFKIMQASANVYLPKGVGANTDSAAAYQGYYGETEPANAQYSRRNNAFSFFSTRPLFEGEGLSVAFNIPAGQLAKENIISYIYKKFLFNREMQFISMGFIVLLIYFILTWHLFGMDPDKGNLTVAFEPPAGISPAAMMYIKDKKAVDPGRMFSSVLLSIAAKGVMSIESKDDGYNTFIFTKKENANIEKLTYDEKDVYLSLFVGRNKVELSNKESTIHYTFNSAASFMLKTIREKTDKFFASNLVFTFVGFAFAAFIICLFIPYTEFYFIGAAIIYAGILAIPCFKYRRRKMWLLTALFTIPAVVFFFYVYEFGACVIFLSTIAGTLFYSTVIDVYTSEGIKILRKIEGFIHYMEIAERRRAEESDPLDRARIYCSFLPYAFALSMESKWAAAFEKDMDNSMFKNYLEERALLSFPLTDLKSIENMFTFIGTSDLVSSVLLGTDAMAGHFGDGGWGGGIGGSGGFGGGGGFSGGGRGGGGGGGR